MNEHQAEILLNRLTNIETALSVIAEAVQNLTAAPAAYPAEKRKTATDSPDKRKTAAEAAEADYREHFTGKEEAEAGSQLSYDDLSVKLTEISRALDPGVFRTFMKQNILPRYSKIEGGGLSTVDPEHYEDVLAECEDFFESRRKK